MYKIILMTGVVTALLFTGLSAKESEAHKKQRLYWEAIAKSATNNFEPRYGQVDLKKIGNIYVSMVKRTPLGECHNRWVMNYEFPYKGELCKVTVPVRYDGSTCENESSLYFEEYKRNCVTQ